MEKYEILKIEELDKVLEYGLVDLLIDVVDNGASVGFLPPLDYATAADYWNTVIAPGTTLWVAVAAGRIVGTVQLHRCLKQNGSHRGEIAKLMVHSSFRKQGLGRKLLSVAIAQAKSQGLTLLTLDTRAGDPSNHLYLSVGFVEAGRIPGYARSANGNLDETIFYYKNLND